WQSVSKTTKEKSRPAERPESRTAPAKKKLSYLDNRDFETIEDRITEAEDILTAKRALLEDLQIASNPKRLQAALAEIDEAQETVDQLYSRWAELEAKIS
ncbi:MAG: ABC transporter ATP-binding protein, partial [Acidobacteriaceae bacterium]|nr:ABC transporter ATP-binding protein [Acidobacteriaceae bacterium]